jgi:hypothetical protein
MEAALASDDPRLQSTLSGGDTATLIRKAPRSLFLAGGLILIGIAILFTGLISQIAPIGVAGFIVTLVGSTPRSSRPKRSLNDRLQERWDRRSFE